MLVLLCWHLTAFLLGHYSRIVTDDPADAFAVREHPHDGGRNVEY